MNRNEAQKSIAKRALNGEFVKRARAGDQNAMATIAQISDMAKKGDPFFKMVKGAIDGYIHKNPAPGFGAEEALSNEIVDAFREVVSFGALTFRPGPRPAPHGAPRKRPPPHATPRIQVRTPALTPKKGTTPLHLTARGAPASKKGTPAPIHITAKAPPKPQDDMQAESNAPSAVNTPTALSSGGLGSAQSSTLATQLNAADSGTPFMVAPATQAAIAAPQGLTPYQQAALLNQQYAAAAIPSGGGGGAPDYSQQPQSDGSQNDGGPYEEEVTYTAPADDGTSADIPANVLTQDAPTDASDYEVTPEDDDTPIDSDAETGEVATDVSGDYGEDAPSPITPDFVRALNKMCACKDGAITAAVILAEGPPVTELIHNMVSQLSGPNQNVMMHGVRRPDAHPRGSLHRVGQALGKAHRLQIVRNGAPIRAYSPQVGWELGE